eukprot:415364-Pelagomonas_calceolata.AAC.1
MHRVAAAALCPPLLLLLLPRSRHRPSHTHVHTSHITLPANLRHPTRAASGPEPPPCVANMGDGPCNVAAAPATAQVSMHTGADDFWGGVGVAVMSGGIGFGPRARGAPTMAPCVLCKLVVTTSAAAAQAAAAKADPPAGVGPTARSQVTHCNALSVANSQGHADHIHQSNQFLISIARLKNAAAQAVAAKADLPAWIAPPAHREQCVSWLRLLILFDQAYHQRIISQDNRQAFRSPLIIRLHIASNTFWLQLLMQCDHVCQQPPVS